MVRVHAYIRAQLGQKESSVERVIGRVSGPVAPRSMTALVEDLEARQDFGGVSVSPHDLRSRKLVEQGAQGGHVRRPLEHESTARVVGGQVPE